MQPNSLLLAFVALAVVLGLIWLAQLAARRGLSPLLRARMGSAPGDGRLAVVRSLGLDPARRLHLVACDGRQVLLLTGGGQDLVVGWLPNSPPAGDAEPAP